MSRVSLEPVAKVVWSSVKNVVPVLRKSFWKSAPVKLPGSGDFFPVTMPAEFPGSGVPLMLNRLSQS